MKATKRRREHVPARAAKPRAAAPPRQRVEFWQYAMGLFVTLAVVIPVYGPAMGAAFLLDGSYLPYSASIPKAHGSAAGVARIWSFSRDADIAMAQRLAILKYQLESRHEGN